MKIKGNKTETTKFLPVFLNEWQERWPKPALFELVGDEGSRANANASNTDASNEAGIEDAVADVADADATDQSASAKKGKKKAKKPLTVSIVRTTSSALAILY